MRLIFISVFLLFAKLSFSQVYFPMPFEAGMMWKVTINTQDGTRFEEYSVIKDTVIFGKNYKEIYYKSNLLGGGPLATYFIREDTTTKRIYIRMPITGDSLMYDFSLQVGDTINGMVVNNLSVGMLRVASIDSVSINGVFHKRFTSEPFVSVGLNKYIFIEGIGSTFGFKTVCSIWQCASNLDCIGKPNVLAIYPDSVDAGFSQVCNIVLNSSEWIEDFPIVIYPVPSSNEIFLKGIEDNVTLNVYNVLGELVIRIEKYKDSVRIDISNLELGLYFLEIKNNDRFISTIKFLKN